MEQLDRLACIGPCWPHRPWLSRWPASTSCGGCLLILCRTRHRRKGRQPMWGAKRRALRVMTRSVAILASAGVFAANALGDSPAAFPVVGVQVPAPPATVPPGAIPTPSISLSAFPVAPGTSVAATADVCDIKQNNPHHSGHAPGNVSFQVSVTCSEGSSALQGQAVLYFNGKEVKNTGGVDQPGAGPGQKRTVNVGDTCRVGQWQGWGGYWVEFPAGFSPPTESAYGWSNPFDVTSC